MTAELMAVYGRAPIEVDRGEGVWLYARDGRRYLDCVSGIATNSLGHANPVLIDALVAQAGRLWHVSNMFRIPGQEALAARLVGASFADVAFFTNSGTEAIECAIKTARRYHAAAAPQRTDVIGFTGSFHGRTYAAMNASGNPAYLEGFGPALPGYAQVDPDDEQAIESAIRAPTTAAVIVEPVQGEGGARAFAPEWLRRLRRLCDEASVLLIHDEVQCGMGRTGRLFAHQWVDDAQPDIMAIAKALGGGFPVGACLATAAAASGMTRGAHGSTFGGNPLAMAVSIAAVDQIAREDTLAHVRAVSRHLIHGLQALAIRHDDVVAGIRGKGLLIGIQLKPDNRAVMALARDRDLLVAAGGDNCIRLLPPLTITDDEAEEVLRRLDATFASVAPAHPIAA